jgi:hypothetical protein
MSVSKVHQLIFLLQYFLISLSVKPLWHLMAFTSVVMYTTNYICLKGKLYCNIDITHFMYTVALYTNHFFPLRL